MNAYGCGGRRAWTYRDFSYQEGGFVYAQERECAGCGRVERREGQSVAWFGVPGTPEHGTVQGYEALNTPV